MTHLILLDLMSETTQDCRHSCLTVNDKYHLCSGYQVLHQLMHTTRMNHCMIP